MARAVSLLCVGFLCIPHSVDPCPAAPIAEVAIAGDWFADGEAHGFQQTDQGPFAASAADGRYDLMYNGGATFGVAALATIVPEDTFASFLKLSAATSGIGVGGSARAVARWTDGVLLNGVSTAPDFIRLAFKVDGALSGSSPDNIASGWRAQFSAYVGSDLSSFSTLDFLRADIGGANVSRLRNNSDSQSFGFQGDRFVVDLPLTGANHYDFDAVFTVLAEQLVFNSDTANAQALFGNSISIVGVTDINDAALHGFDVAFDSGRTIAAVPEPGAALLLVAMLCAATTRRSLRLL